MTAMEIIDNCNYEELCRFNAPLLANQTISIGQQIEMYYNGGVSEEHGRKRKEKVAERGKSVMEKIIAMGAFWRRPKSKKGARGGWRLEKRMMRMLGKRFGEDRKATE